ncbi:bifunctional DNA polymerase III subunit epsilon/ATP-dependent DNA helicase [Halalkalibacter wakoensis JCM 9140]|uniref:Bifunctional DNA polymerase III subunit epsilon/ATP-dependent DNA helicase n=1 Tax=Halalkalibacter wakoensis JCM 9140 TaxID=1236970 RepID=W4PZ77_9BACI|nr:hypothetical protein [Halalkalibacter wakoensis]GAE25042.1 bifunctional DNA polymerase III subunit epsilon/ATP-dependent DNA helicase [Halalkalibacter wakoensis JCM 9140]
MRKLFIGLLCFVVLSVMLGLEVRMVITSNGQDEEVELDLQLEEEDIGFVFLDLPNGEATYVELPNEESVLIGTGSNDCAESLFFRLKKLNVSSIETIILPRFEKEYSGNVEEVTSRLGVKTLIVPEAGMNQAKTQYEHLDVDIIGWSDKQEERLADHVEVKILPSKSSIMPTLSFLVTVHNKHQFFFSSEANEELEKDWVQKGLSPVSLLKVAEFGTNNGTSQRFLNELDPQVAILFTRENGEVSGQLLERLQETWIDTYRTKQNGSVIVKVSQTDYELVTVHFQAAK